MKALGIDIGSAGIEGCIVDTRKGEIVSERKSMPPLEDTTPHKVLAQMHQIVRKEFAWKGDVGCAFPAPVNNGIVLSGKGIDDSWVDANAEQLFSEITDNPVSVINNADATGLAEMHFGAGQNQEGLTIVLTVGPTMGSALFMDGRLVPNTELGLMEIRGITAEKRASQHPPEENNLRKERWADRLQVVLEHFDKVFHPDLFILGGELGQMSQKVFPYLKVNTAFKAADLRKGARIIGAALIAGSKSG